MMKNFRLTKALLASTILWAASASADLTINTCPYTKVGPPAEPPVLTSADGNVTIAPTGCIQSAGTDGVTIDSANALTISPNNTQGTAINTTGVGFYPIDVTVAGGTITIGGTSVSNKINGTNDSAINVSASVTITNSGNITSQAAAGSGINVNTTGSGTTITNSGIITDNVGTGLTANATTFQLTNNKGAFINGQTLGILLGTSATGAIISNSGDILSATQAMEIDASGVMLTNNTGGNIAGLAVIVLSATGSGATITNNGLIASGGAGIAINNSGPNLTLSNSGQISSVSADAIQLNETDTSTAITTITNTGTITTGGTGNAININASNATNFTNITNSKSINTTGSGAAILISNPFTGVITNNSGGQIVGTGTGPGIYIKGAVTGTIENNTGATISSAGAQAINVAGSINNIDNAGGTIATTGANASAVIQATASNINSVTITNNGGNITSAAAAAQMTATNPITSSAIDLQNGTTGVVGEIIQEAGTITGNIDTASGGGLGGVVLSMTGGTINGTVFTGKAALQPSATLDLDGGTITYNATSVNLGGVGDTVNINGTTLNLIDMTTADPGGTNTINFTSGSFTGINGNNANTTDVLNVLGNLDFNNANGINNVRNIHVASPATFTLDAPGVITGPIIAFTIDAGGAFVANNNIGNAGSDYTVNNAGTLSVGDGFTFNTGIATTTNTGNVNLQNNAELITHTYTQTNGVYAVELQGPATSTVTPGSSGRIITGPGPATLSGTINPYLGANSFLANGSFFDILSSVGGGITDTTTLVQPNSATISFTKVDTALGDPRCAAGDVQCILLITVRTPFEELANCPAAQGFAGVLDFFVNQPGGPTGDFLLLTLALDQASAFEITEALETLSPPVNGSISWVSGMSAYYAYENVRRRLEDLTGLQPIGEFKTKVIRKSESQGFSYGDGDGESTMGNWIAIDGTYADQKRISCADGFKGDSATLAIGTDFGILDNGVRVGFEFNQTNTRTVGKNTNASLVDAKSNQGTIYAWFDPYPSVYADLALGFAVHKYQTRRNINIIGESAYANFGGIEYGGRADLGYAMLYDDAVFAPFIRGQYRYLQVDPHTETGAGIFNLSNTYDNQNEFLLGGGFRFTARRGNLQVAYAPEAYLLYLRNLYFDQEQVHSSLNFPGATFTTTGPKRERNRYIFGLGLNTHSSDRYVFSIRYEGEVRDHFLSNTGFVQLSHYWD